MLETKTDQSQPNLEIVIDKFIDLIQAMLNRTSNRRQLYKLILKSFEPNDSDQLIARVRELSYHTKGTLQLHWSFGDLYNAASLSENEKQIFFDRIKEIVSVKDDFLPQNGLRDWETLDNDEKTIVYNLLVEEQKHIARVYIDGEWDMYDLQSFLLKLGTIYGQFLELHILEHYRLTYDSPHLQVMFGNEYDLGDFSNLQILQMQYASPGHFDFLGIGKIFEQLIEIVNKIIHWKQEYNLAKLQRTKQQFDLVKEMKLDLDKLNLDVQTKRELEEKLNKTARGIFNWIKPEQIRKIGWRPEETNRND